MEPIIKCLNCKTDFPRRALKCPSCSQVGISKLFKYLPFSERSLSILINKQIYCPKASSLNDPFEFNFNLAQDSINGIPIDQSSLEQAKDDMKKLPLICFSEINDHILLWSHYALGHTGFCIEFERKENNDLGNWDHCAPVIYNADNNVPSFTPEDLQKQSTFAKIATIKSLHWSYEKEWRLIIKHDFADKLISLPAPISRIIFGCNMDKNRRRTIVNILGKNMQYAETKKSKNYFALDIIAIAYDELICFE